MRRLGLAQIERDGEIMSFRKGSSFQGLAYHRLTNPEPMK